MKSIDIKSLLIGILGTALVMVLMGQSSMQKQYDVECVSSYHKEINDHFVHCVKFNTKYPIGIVNKRTKVYSLSGFTE